MDMLVGEGSLEARNDVLRVLLVLARVRFELLDALFGVLGASVEVS